MNHIVKESRGYTNDYNKQNRLGCGLKSDEFYTLEKDVEYILDSYKQFLNDKVIYFCCDSEDSNFYKVVVNKFKELGIKKAYFTAYNQSYCIVLSIYNNEVFQSTYDIEKEENFVVGDMFSSYCQDIMKSCDVVVTNPPFTRFRELINCIEKYKKDFILLCNIASSICNFNFKEDKERKVRNLKYYIDYRQIVKFINCEGIKKPVRCCIVSSFFKDKKEVLKSVKYEDVKDKCLMDITNKYLIVPNIHSIPYDYDGLMSVPVTYSYYYTYDNSPYEIIGCKNDIYLRVERERERESTPPLKKKLFSRIIIQRSNLKK